MYRAKTSASDDQAPATATRLGPQDPTPTGLPRKLSTTFWNTSLESHNGRCDGATTSFNLGHISSRPDRAQENEAVELSATIVSHSS
jgi:hypothetical protein